MKITSTLKTSLLSRYYLLAEENVIVNKQTNAYLNAYLLSTFGIVVDKPMLLTKGMVEQISDLLHLNVPKSFYNNPQDTKFFTREELLIEQLVAYYVGYGTEAGRIELFAKDLTEYQVGDELKLRSFSIITKEEANEVLLDIMNSYCAYTRPFSIDEMTEFLELYRAGFYTNTEIKCKDNIFSLLHEDEAFARFLDKKDIVKLSIQKFGDGASFKNAGPRAMKELQAQFAELACYIPYVKHCPMSKKQAKYFNKIVKMSRVNHPKMTNAQSPDRRAMKFITEGDVVAAAHIYAENGSMLERRIRMLLARANPREAIEILEMLPANNPIAMYQLFSSLTEDEAFNRTFTFFHNNKVRVHRESDYEATYRKSRLNESTCKFLAEAIVEKIKTYYSNLPKLGKVYINEAFYKVGVPTNTSASGRGVDVLPIGSRVPCTGSAVRTFVHWKDAFDIDSSLIVIDKNNNLSTMGWFNYGTKPYGDIHFSGDITGRNGAEYFDIDLEALAKKGYKYVIQTFHGYNSKLDEGKIYAGYQNKDNLNTRAWDPKNIEMQFRVQGDSRGCIAFAIDVQNREAIILNQIVESDERVVRADGFKTIEKYLKPEYIKINLGMIAECRGELVTDPAEADVVFDDTFTVGVDLSTEQEVKLPDIIRSWELEKLVKFVNS